MKNIKLILGGKGAECHVHDINKAQKERFINGDVQNDKMSLDLICEILNINFFEEGARFYSGVYNSSDQYYIAALDENNNLIFESTEGWSLPIKDYKDMDDSDLILVETTPNKFIIEDSVKGNFIEYVLELDDDFDPNKLSPVITDISNTIEIITSLKYDGKEIKKCEYGDNWSKKLNFYLV